MIKVHWLETQSVSTFQNMIEKWRERQVRQWQASGTDDVLCRQGSDATCGCMPREGHGIIDCLQARGGQKQAVIGHLLLKDEKSTIGSKTLQLFRRQHWDNVWGWGVSPADFNDLMYTSWTDVNWGTFVVILFCVLGTGPGVLPPGAVS